MLGIALLAIALVGASYIGWRYWQLRHELDRWQSDWQRLTGMAAQVSKASTPEDRERLGAELRFANRIIDKLDTPWDALFGAVEGAYSDQAILLSVEPDTERREVRLSAEAKDMATMLAYLEQVRQSPVLRNAYLVSHQINLQDPQRPVRFVIEAAWNDMPAQTASPTPEAATPAAGAPDVKGNPT